MNANVGRKRPLRIESIEDSPENNLTVDYVDATGRRKNQTREFVRTPGKVFGVWTDSDVVVLDLNEDVVSRKAQQPKLPDKGTIFGVKSGDINYILDFSSSAAKNRHLTLINVEKRIAAKHMQYAEQSVYGQRFYMTNARRAVRGSFRVGLKPEGFVLPNGDVVGDGLGYCSTTMWKKLMTEHAPQMTMLDNQPRDSFQLYRMSWDKIKDEAIPKIQRNMDLLLDRTHNFFRKCLANEDEKSVLLGIEPEEMESHPLLVNAFTRESRLAVAAASYSVPFEESHYKLAIPVKMPEGAGKVAFREGRWVLGRYPFTSNAAIRAYHIEKAAADFYRKHVAKKVGMQYSMSALTPSDDVNFGAKGLLLATADRHMLGYDVIICSKDIKMGSLHGRPNKKGVASLGEINVVDGYLGALQVYGPGAFFGVDIEEWTGFPGDFDGDGGVFYECSDFMSFWEAIRDLPRKENFKIVNSETPYSDRSISIKAWQVMNSYLGRISNCMSSTFAVENREQLAKDMGFTTAEAMDDRIAYLAQIEVDRYKKNCSAALKKDMIFFKINNPDRVMGKIVDRLESNLVTALGRVAPWTGWKRNEDVFRFYVPRVWEEGMPKNEVEEAIYPRWDGCVAEILKITLPQMGEKLQLAATVRPLGYYYTWARPVSPQLEALAKKIVYRFASELITINEMSENALEVFKDRWQDNMRKWEKSSGFKPEVLCSALWRASHNVDSQFSSAIAPFWCFPKQAEDIVRFKPGLERVNKAKVVGLNKRIPTGGGPDLLVNVRVVIEDIKLSEVIGKERRKRLARVIRSSASEIPSNEGGQDRTGYPKDYLAEIPYDAVVYPACGKYTASFKRVSRAAWVMELSEEL